MIQIPQSTATSVQQQRTTITSNKLNESLIISDASLESDSEVLSSSSASSSPSSASASPNVLKTLPATSVPSYYSDFTRNAKAANLANHSQLVMDSFNEALQECSDITMLPNFNIQPTGKEFGDFLVIDLGGSTLRVAVIQIKKSGSVSIVVEKKWIVDNSFKLVDLNFFKWIASKIVETLNSQSVIDPSDTKLTINTGLTWSFPLDQTSHNIGKIKYMGKGYTIAPEIHQRDLKDILESSLRENFNININIHVLINDSLAVYAAGAFLDKYMKLAVVLGTGFNVCCSLQTSSLHPSKTLNQDAVLLNCEASLFGQALLKDLANKYDEIIDYRLSSIQTFDFRSHFEVDGVDKVICQPSELMTSGRYLPELCRLVICDLIETPNSTFLRGIPSKYLDSTLRVKYEGLSGELTCFISENDDEQKIVSKIKSMYGWEQNDDIFITKEDISTLKEIVECVIERAAYIVAVFMVAMIKLIEQHNGKSADTQLNIGFVGSVLEYFHKYRDLILKYINEHEEIQSRGLTVGFKSVDNSSIVGAAVGAAYYSNEK